MTHEYYMQIALRLAIKGLGRVAPNPMVGAVIVHSDKVIGQGYHEQFGKAHAEINALATCINEAKGATLYVTLEPCCHYGKTPPCTRAIIKSGIKRVVVGVRDPNPKVSGKGIEMLKAYGIEVVEDILREKCTELNRFFFHHMKTKMPYVAMKYAMSVDGKIATKTGESKWISSDDSRAHVQKLRMQYQGIMVGIGTVLKDDPHLTYRRDQTMTPIRIICDSRLRMPLASHISQTAKEIKTFLVCSKEYVGTNEGILRRKALEERGFYILDNLEKEGHIDLRSAMKLLGEQGLQSILLEGGGTLNEAVLREQLVQYLYAFVAPKILGGKEAYTPVSGIGVDSMKAASLLKLIKIKKLKDDVLLEYIFEKGDEPCLLES